MTPTVDTIDGIMVGNSNTVETRWREEYPQPALKAKDKYIATVVNTHDFKFDTNLHDTSTMVSPSQGLTYFKLSFKYYPVATLFTHAMTWPSAIMLAAYFIADITVVHPIVLMWAVFGFGGLTIVLWKAGQEIERSRSKLQSI